MLDLTDINFNDLEKNLLNIINRCFKEIKLIKDKSSYLKKDGTPVTLADKIINNIITDNLLKLYPAINIISEEGILNKNNFTDKIYWLIDPIDGTSNYLRGGSGFTVNIALIFEGNPVVGIIGHPPTNTVWFGCKNRAYKKMAGKKITLKASCNINSPRIIVSQNYDNKTELFVNKINSSELIKSSSSIKFCKIAEGKADIYPRLHSIKKWDIAAGDAILRAAGGIIIDKNMTDYNYKTLTVDSGIFFAVSSKRKWKNIIKPLLI